jgi:phage terminase large subunit-like protein
MVIDLGYQPHQFQRLVHENATRFTVIVSHRRFGKTYLSTAQLVDAALRTKETDGRFAYIAPYLGQAKRVAWGYVKQWASKVPGATIHEGELIVKFPNGSHVALFGADNPDSLRGQYFSGLCLDELADMKSDTWGSIIRPALSDRKGWAYFIVLERLADWIPSTTSTLEPRMAS